jgi:hypothetical protein
MAKNDFKPSKMELDVCSVNSATTSGEPSSRRRLVLSVPFRARTAHIMQFRLVGVEYSSPKLS